MIDKLVNWVQNVFEIDSCEKLHLLFFRGFQILEGVSSFYLLITLRPFLGNHDPLLVGMNAVYFSSIVWGIGFILLAEVGWRLVQKGSIVGFWIGMTLSLASLLSVKILLGIFGFYAFLNPRSQQRLLQNAPAWLREVLSSLKVNFLDSR